MRLPWSALAAVVAVTAFAAPAHGALFFHVTDSANLDGVPMNVLEPPANVTFRAGAGPTGATFSCLAAAGAPSQESHTVFGIAYAGVTDDFVLPQSTRGEWRGLAYGTDVAGNMTLHWYLETSAQVGGPGPDPDAAPIPIPNVVVRATVRDGEDLGTAPAGYDLGTEIASGESAPAILAGPQTQGVAYDVVAGHYVYNFTVPLQVSARQLRETGFNVRVDVRADNPLCATTGGSAMAPLVRLHGSPGHRPRLDIAVERPFQAGAVVATESQAGIVHVRAEVLPVWGAYALAGSAVEVHGPGPASNTTTQVVLPGIAATRTAPAFLFWNWDAARLHGVAGEYQVDITVRGADGASMQLPTVGFELQHDADHPTAATGKPSPAPALGLGVLAVAAFAQRKRS
ncbi:MAG: hypothetical protein ABR562_03485 [Thermoplasmatota archaeon]|nr:hypothetical protein [Halobacteriales archaeon]